MLDVHLAELYNVTTGNLNKAVKRNIERFPKDFMFQLTREELLIFQNGIPNNKTTKRGGSRYNPYAFTEQGVAMLSSVLHSNIAINVNIHIMRAFVMARHIITDNNSLVNRIELLECDHIEVKQKQMEIHQWQITTNKRIEQVFQLMERNNEKPQQGVFYNGQIYDAYTFISDLVRNANSRITLIDNYVDDTVLTLLDKRNEHAKATIYTSTITPKLKLDLEKHNAQYSPIEIKTCKAIHDRFLIIDGQFYHIGASIKDLGKKLFAFSLMQELTAEELLQRIE